MILFFKLYYFFFGACIGSFLNVLIYRIPLEEKEDLTKRSSCPACKQQIPFYLNIPLFSYILLRGKCRNCSFKIPLSYFLNELMLGLAGLIILYKPMSIIPEVENILLFSLFAAFVVHFWIDVRHQILPDKVNLYIGVTNLFLVIFCYDLPWSHWVLGGLIGFGGTFIITYLYYLWRKVQGFGGGDLKLFGALGILLGPQGVVLNIFYSCFLGAIVGSIMLYATKKSTQTPFAFGPAIILVSVFQIFFPSYFDELSKLIFLR